MGFGEPGSLVGVVLVRTKEPTCAAAVAILYIPRLGCLSVPGTSPYGRHRYRWRWGLLSLPSSLAPSLAWRRAGSSYPAWSESPLLVPAAVLGLAKPSPSGLLIVGRYVGISALTLLLAYLGRGLRRLSGWLIIAAYALFAAAVLAST